MSDDELNILRATAQGWTGALASMQTPTEEHIAAAQAALDALDEWPIQMNSGAAHTTANLRTALSNAQVRMVATQLRDMPLPEAPPGPSAGYDAEQDAPEPDPWEEWTGPATAMPDEGPGDIADRVATDLDGAAELVTRLGRDAPVRADIMDASSFTLARVLAAGAATVRMLAVQRPAGPQVSVEPLTLDTVGMVRAIRDATEDRGDLSAQVCDLRECLAESEAKRKDAERIAADLRTESGLRADTIGVLRGQLADSFKDWRWWAEQVVKSLGTWAPGYADHPDDDFRTLVIEIARQVRASERGARRSLASLTKELQAMVGSSSDGDSRPLLVRVQELVSAGKGAPALHEQLDEIWAQRAADPS
jgi:hypothetical protein